MNEINVRDKSNASKGITLIALIITIIVLLILAAISIATLTGENGILRKASTAGEETKQAEYKEVLQLIGNALRPEQIIENLSAKEFMDRYQRDIEDEIKKGQTLKDAETIRKSPEKIWVITKEGYVYEITENKVELIGQQGENPPPDLQESDINFNLNPSGFTNTDVIVEITTNIDIQNNILEYSTNGTSWQKYEAPITFEQNGTIYARLINALEETGGVATKAIDKIDKDNPNEATVEFNTTSVDIKSELTATVTQTDRGVSNINIDECKWIYTESSNPLGENEEDYTGGFKENPEELKTTITKVGTYYLHILTIDNANNKTETIKGPIEVTLPPTTSTLKEGSYINYIDKNGNKIKCAVLWGEDTEYGVDRSTNSVYAISSKYNSRRNRGMGKCCKWMEQCYFNIETTNSELFEYRVCNVCKISWFRSRWRI